MTTSNLDLSVVIITHNEEDNLERCLTSLPKDAQIIIVDSYSNDKTEMIAKSFGAQFHQHPFNSYAEQKNVALSLAKRNWILSVDADEELDESLRQQLVRMVTISNNLKDDVCAYKIKRKLVFMQRTMHFGKSSDYPIRLIKRGSCEFVGAIHERLDIASKKIAKLPQGILYHHSYKNLTDYFNRFNRYTSQVANEHFAGGKRQFFGVHLMRPWFEFIYRYFIRLGFLDGYAGYTYALVSSLYSYMKYAKLYELLNHDKNRIS